MRLIINPKNKIDYNSISLLMLWMFNLILPNIVQAKSNHIIFESKANFSPSTSKKAQKNKKTQINLQVGQHKVQKKKDPRSKDINLPSKLINKTKHDENILNSTVLFDRENDNDGSGPSSPEFSGFESVSTDKMVDPFTGDFTYNLPLLEVPGAHDGGYPITLSYHSGVGAEAEASWVGHGFTLSPGAINRSKRGFPDDIKNASVQYINAVPPNVSVSVTPTVNGDVFSANLSLARTYTYNNYKGIRKRTTFGIGNGYGSLSFTYDNGKHSFSPSINILDILNGNVKKRKAEEKKTVAWDKLSFKDTKVKFSMKKSIDMAKNSLPNGKTMVHFLTHAIGNDVSAPTSVSQYEGTSKTFALSIVTDPALVIAGIGGGLSCNISETHNLPDLKRAYGYIYSDEAYAQTDNNAIMDYHMEKEATASWRDNYLPVTIADPDQFSVSAEGISGTFRAYWRKGGLFEPTKTKSTILQSATTGSVHLGTDIGAGVNVSIGESVSTMKSDWENDYYAPNNGATDDLAFEKVGEEPILFRFNGDQTGHISVDDNFNVVSPTLSGGTNTPDISNVSTQLSTTSNFLNSGRVGRSSHIKYFKNSEIITRMSSEISANSGANINSAPRLLFDYEYLTTGNSYINRASLDVQDHIGEFVVTNGNGATYVFALPVYNRNEKSMQYNVPYSKRNEVDNNGKGDYFIHAKIDASLPHTGEEHNYPFANSYLLTSIRSNNYQDLNNDGMVGDDDLGGYTKFEYERTYGSADKVSGTWFNWRMPHHGLFLSQGQLSDRTDDMGSFTSGEKEIYNLKKIETKTHVAYFITNKTLANASLGTPAGSGVSRPDGRGAASNNFAAAENNINGPQESTQLEKIILYAKKSGTNALKKIKTVNFKYAYQDVSAWPGVWPDGFGNSQGSNNGKLTLTKVWVDEEQVLNAKISPYEFKYTYPQNPNYPTPKYQNIKNFYTPFTGTINSTPVQEPNYLTNHAINTDRWGNYQAEGQQRRQTLNSYVDQTPLANFDPAAWELKQIKLPTGAEIHVQYEQDDYAFVQDKFATTMVNFKPNPITDSTNQYKLNLENIPTSEIPKYLTFLQQYFTDNPYIYFRFLYGLKSTPSGLPLNATNCNQEYIDGYVKLNPSNITGLPLGNPNPTEIMISVGNGNPTTSPDFNFLNTTGTSLPRYLCYDYFITETGKQAGNCMADGSKDEVMGSASGMSVAKDVLKYCLANIDNALGADYCVGINEQQSYFRLPVMPTANYAGKLGGGLRVKRVLMFDQGMEASNADKALYGTEYIYKLEDNITSSGVAANEPLDGKDENPIIDYLKKKDDQNLLQKLLGGLDKTQFEGPYGESFLPSASVGYSRIIAKSIHEDKTDIGFTVNEYFTAKDYPFDKQYMIDGQLRKPFDNDVIQKIKSFPIDIPAGIVNISNRKIWFAQGHRFISFSRHGLQKSVSSYAGANSQVLNTTINPPLYEKTFTYYEPWDNIPVVKNVITETPVAKPIGREMEIYTERRYIDDVTLLGGANADAGCGLVFPPVVITVGVIPTVTKSVSRLSRLSTTKVVYLPNILKSTTETKEGITTKTENIAFSEYDGTPVVTKISDIFHNMALSGNAAAPREIWNYNQEAALNYNAFKPKSLNDCKVWSNSGNVIYNATQNILYFDYNITSGIENWYLNAGDLLLFDNNYINSTSNKYFNISGVNYFQSGVNNMVRYFLEPYKSTASLSSFNFSNFTVVRSGKTNTIATPAGAITTFNSANYSTTTPTGQSDRNSFLANLNSNIGFINGNGTSILPNCNTDNFKKITGGTTNCITNYPRLFGCNTPGDTCIKKECCLILGTITNEPLPATPMIYHIFCADKAHTLSLPTGYPSAPTMPTILNNKLTTTLDPCCTSNGTNCNLCPPPSSNSSLPYYLNSYSINLSSPTITNTAGNRFIVKPLGITSPQGYGIYYEPNTSTSILIPFLTGIDQSMLIGFESALESNLDNVIQLGNYQYTPQITSTQGLRCMGYDLIGKDYNNDGSIKPNELFRCKDCYNFMAAPPCNCSTVTTCEFSLKTFTNTSTNEMYVAVLDKYHSSSTTSTTNSPSLDPFLSSIAAGNFTNNKQGICSLNPCSLCPPAPSSLLPYIINYQKVGKPGGTFSLDPYNQFTVLYTPPNDEPLAVNVLTFCNGSAASGTISNVLANNASTFKHNWKTDDLPSYYLPTLNLNPQANNFAKNRKGFWNTHKSFAYKNDRTVSNPNATNKIYDKGTYLLDFGGWVNPNVSTKWIATSTIKNLSPNGEPLEEIDALNIPSTSSFMHDKTLPTYVANNAAINTVWFESMEAPNYTPGGQSVSLVSTPHAGEKCVKLTSGWSYYENIMTYPSSFYNQDVLVHFWASLDPTYKELNGAAAYQFFDEIKGEFSITPSNNIGFTAKKVASSGLWNLYEAKVKITLLPLTSPLKFQIWNSIHLSTAPPNNYTTTLPLFIDDIRIQPLNAKVGCYVFDYTKRKIVTEFDDQHFGFYYLYNAEGKLVRKIKETERGLKMLEERQYNQKHKTNRL